MHFRSVAVLPCVLAASSDVIETCFDIVAAVVVALALLAAFAAPLLWLQESELRVTLHTGSESEQSQVQKLLQLLEHRAMLFAACLILRVAGMVALPLLLSPHMPGPASVAASVGGFLVIGELLPYVCFAGKVASAQRLLPLARLSMTVCFPVACLAAGLCPCFSQSSTALNCQDLKHLVEMHDSLSPSQMQSIQSLLRAKKESVGAHMTSFAKALTITEEELSQQDVTRKLARWGLSRVPVFKDKTIVGVLLVKDLRAEDVKLQTPLMVPYDTSLFTLLHRLGEHGGDIAVVTSSVEKTETPMGFITLQQVMQALLGVTLEDRLKHTRGALDMDTVSCRTITTKN